MCHECITRPALQGWVAVHYETCITRLGGGVGVNTGSQDGILLAKRPTFTLTGGTDWSS